MFSFVFVHAIRRDLLGRGFFFKDILKEKPAGSSDYGKFMGEKLEGRKRLGGQQMTRKI